MAAWLMVLVCDRQDGSPSRTRVVFGSSLSLDWFKVQPELAGTEVDLLWWELHCICCFVLHSSPFVAAVLQTPYHCGLRDYSPCFSPFLFFSYEGGVLVCTNKLLIQGLFLFF